MPAKKKTDDKKVVYGLEWNVLLNPVIIEITMIKAGGYWKKKNGTKTGNGLFFHYRQLQSLLWPEDDHHRWSDLMLENILSHTITGIMGGKDSSKTHCALSKFGLTDYFCFPNETLTLLSSTDVRGLELRVWGDLKNLFQRAKSRFDFLPGHMLDSKHAICTQDLKEDDVRDMRLGLICIPTVSSSGSWQGLGKYVGIKQKRRRLLADECQLMKPSFLDSLANLNSGDFKGVFCGNPIGQGDPLDKICEPKDGWASIGEPEKTTTWDNRFESGITINLVGTDSPNFDFPQDQPPKYPYLINKHSIERVVQFYGKDSLQYYSQCKGVRKSGLDARRVITRKLCEKFGAFQDAVWKDERRTKVYAIDAAYGNLGGDRCVGGWGEFGMDVENNQVIRINMPVIIPVSVNLNSMPEDQIAEFVKNDCATEEIPPERVFYDATGRGSLGTSFARIWSPMINPIEFGGKPTDRPVSLDLTILDPLTKNYRLKLCNEHYSKFVTELWFTVRYIIEARQMRNLPLDVMDEGCQREWKLVKDDKIEIETKADMKERMGRSPDLFDWLATLCEGARRLGFMIKKLGNPKLSEESYQWKRDAMRKEKELHEKGQLNYKA